MKDGRVLEKEELAVIAEHINKEEATLLGLPLDQGSWPPKMEQLLLHLQPLYDHGSSDEDDD